MEGLDTFSPKAIYTKRYLFPYPDEFQSLYHRAHQEDEDSEGLNVPKQHLSQSSNL